MLVLSCQEGARPATDAPGSAGAGTAREPVFADRTKEADYKEARRRLFAILAAGQRGIDPKQGAELGFECASLRTPEKSLAGEQDPLIQRLVADIEKTCAFDLPLATAKAELLVIVKKKKADASASTRSECLGMQIALGDIGGVYASNPDVVEVGGKYATYCPPSP